jgi:purine-nucleoside phosphorylase
MSGADVAASAARLRQACAGAVPRIAVLLGSGWSPFADALDAALSLPYADLPGFPLPEVEGHAARLAIGRCDGVPVLVLAGRRHTYEDGRADGMAGPIRTLAALGCEVLIQTNAAGSLDERMRPGSLMLITDHLNLVQTSPLFGERDARRFVDLGDAYDPALREAALRAAKRQRIALHQGVYAWVVGPQFETPAEIRMLRLLGAQAVGMSTVPETILARHAGLRVVALSMFTNMACGLGDEPLAHDHTLAVAERSRAPALTLLADLVAEVQAVLQASAGRPGATDATPPPARPA